MKFTPLSRSSSGDIENQSDLVTVSLFNMGSDHNSSSSGRGRKNKRVQFEPLSPDSSHALEIDDGSDIIFRDEPPRNCFTNLYENKPRTFGGCIICFVFVLPLFITVICLAALNNSQNNLSNRGNTSNSTTITVSPTLVPTFMPTTNPTVAPSLSPTIDPSINPTVAPTEEPTLTPTDSPSFIPTAAPTQSPSLTPTAAPTVSFNQYSVVTTKGAVATDTSICSTIGANILDMGGNAVDAAVASAFCVGVLSPASSGIGGGCYILMHNASTGQNTFIDSRERAPSGANYSMFVSDPMAAQFGGLAVAVLGEVKGLHLAWSQYGSGVVSWSDVVTPSALLAANWTISQEVANILASLKEPFDGSPQVPGLYTTFYELFMKDGKVKSVGDTVQQPQLSHTLYQIAEQGPDYLYKTMARNLSAEIIAMGGIVTPEDIMSYEPTILPAIETSVFGHTYIGVGGSSSGGGVVAGILKFMSSFSEPMVSMGDLYYHRLVEAYKNCFAIRLSLGDPQYVNTTEAMDSLLSDTYMAALAAKTSNDNVLPLDDYGGKFNITYSQVTDHGTTHLSVVDTQGNAVGITSTINQYFGSFVFSNSTGMVLNNQMDDFSIPGVPNSFHLAPSPFNYPEPQKRPLSSMSPSILVNSEGKVRLVGGGSGGPRIITATAQVILNYFGKGMDLLSALIEPRVHSQLLPDSVDIENSTMKTGLTITGGTNILEALVSRHHNNVTFTTKSMGVTQFIAIDPDSGEIEAVSDPRKYGTPACMH